MITMEQMVQYEIAYRIGEPKISDIEWDKLVIETGYKENLYDSVFANSLNGRKRIPMMTPMVSLRKVYKIEELINWVKSEFNDNENIVIEPKLDGNAVNISYIVNEDGTATRRFIGSPGDGLFSMITFPNALDNVKIIGAPEALSKETVDLFRENNAIINNIIEIRGEGIINKDLWTESNKFFEEPAWRQLVAGIMCRQTGLSWKTVEEKLEKVDFNLIEKSPNQKVLSNAGIVKAIKDSDIYDLKDTIKYEHGDWYIISKDRINKLSCILPELVQFGSKIKSNQEILNIITYSCSTKDGNKDASFLYKCKELYTFEVFDNFEKITNSNATFAVSIISKKYFLENYENYFKMFFGIDLEVAGRNGCYQCDGLVFKHENQADEGVFRTRNGSLAHDTTNALALKLFPEHIETTIKEIYNSVTEKGNTTSHAIIDPITYMGSTITNLNLFNPSWVEERKSWIYVGAKVNVTFSGDLIPIIIKSI